MEEIPPARGRRARPRFSELRPYAGQGEGAPWCSLHHHGHGGRDEHEYANDDFLSELDSPECGPLNSASSRVEILFAPEASEATGAGLGWKGVVRCKTHKGSFDRYTGITHREHYVVSGPAFWGVAGRIFDVAQWRLIGSIRGIIRDGPETFAEFSIGFFRAPFDLGICARALPRLNFLQFLLTMVIGGIGLCGREISPVRRIGSNRGKGRRSSPINLRVSIRMSQLRLIPI